MLKFLFALFQESKRIASLELVREQLLQALDQYAKLLAGDTSVTEPDDEHIQKLTLATAREERVDPSQPGASMQPLFQMNANENFGAFPSSTAFPPPNSAFPAAPNKNGSSVFGADPFDPGSGDAFGFGTQPANFATASSSHDLDPFVPVQQNSPDPFSPQLKGSSDHHSKSSFDSNKFDAVFGSAPTESTPFSSNASSNSKKVPPPRPATQPNVSKHRGSHTDGAARQNDSPKGKLRGVFGKAGGGGAGKSLLTRSTSSNHSGQGGAGHHVMSEEEQLRWATLESRRSAEQEEMLRAKEEADLELALRLSRLESGT
uniref:Epidermal growth factor receptor substrate 15-like 1 n=1 Tax=Mesocestoides corti TaxID=53468 RepID=A0A5K3F597_MESCO